MSNNYYKASRKPGEFMYFFFDDRDGEATCNAFDRAAEFVISAYKARPAEVSIAVNRRPICPAAARVPVVPVVGEVADRRLVQGALDLWIDAQKARPQSLRPGPGLAKCGVPEASPSVAVGGGS